MVATALRVYRDPSVSHQLAVQERLANASSFAKPLIRALDGETLPCIGAFRSLQLLSEIGERPELLGASFTNVGGERIGWLVFIRHLA
jgi:hypothetical protein